MPIILGVDPGTNYTGWGIVQTIGNKVTYIASGVITQSKLFDHHQKLLRIHTELNKVANQFTPDLAILEDSFVNSNPKTSLILGITRGAIILTLMQAGLNPQIIAPTQIKKFITGNGRADKLQIAKMLGIMLGVNNLQQDEADALAIAYSGLSINKLHELYKKA
ncbi:crossover junction endodeoxyribonuclease RuvC [Rickettsiales endosymbiont of Stachyamoeba lipophora]|uniref:crossover junction endodeoxyribonuclease RuvC n=1 Tax=Rickettsiales endosymbiont of Stachyamoeba lipophora TaxID=2486578 RepID=UPI000F64C6D4|nr:crossover junction endodeoxyribonuclease RuvC [Rickettsiales endosymbiont of Stachyamoeba lipophora]AZL15725.1 crossover junction endodeoxyribonuclease RuvC [Rickettsiales endosymbiont of Stachyamoeba lipophora]